MFDHVVFGASNYAASKAFFLEALEPLGFAIVSEGPLGIEMSADGKTSLCLRLGEEENPAPLHLAFVAGNREQVDAFHRAALAAGGKDNGAPGLRPRYHPNYYAAFVIGPDGHNIEAVCHEPEGSTREIDALVARFFAFFDNRGGATPGLSDLEGCFTDRATIVRRSATGADVYTVGDFALPRIALLTSGALREFHEWETRSTTQMFAGIATRTSRYSKSGMLDGKPYTGSGTKCFQFVHLGSGWRISALAWVDDDAANP